MLRQLPGFHVFDCHFAAMAPPYADIFLAASHAAADGLFITPPCSAVDAMLI